jgi:hypothetical protein
LDGALSLYLVPLGTPRPAAGAVLAAVRPGGLPLAIARHRRPEVAAEVERLLASGHRFDAVHVEQLHALPQAVPALERGLPVVLRAQNVESDLWRGAARLAARSSGPGPRWLRGAALAFEGRRLARWEGWAVGRVAAVAALTAADAGRLGELASAAGVAAPRVVEVAAPFPEQLPGGGHRLAGEPAVVLRGSGGWLPNRDAEIWFEGEIWPQLRRRLPGAVLHRFGGKPAGPGASGVVEHPPPDDSAEAFAPGSILVVPLRLASGVRMKVLEAWARGVPVVATPQAAAGLEAEDGRELLLASDAGAFAEAVARLASEPALAGRLITAGRGLLTRRHRPAEIARRLIELYGEPGGGSEMRAG